MEGFGARDAAVVFEVGFVPHQHDGHGRVVVFHVCDLLAQLGEFGEGGGRGDAEDEEEALGVAHVHFSARGLVRMRRLGGLGVRVLVGDLPY